MDRNMLDYMAVSVSDYKEIKSLIESEQAQFELLENALASTLKNTFILDCDLKGVLRYEKMLNLVVDESKPLDERRQIILNRWNRKLPYTLQVLNDLVSGTAGKENVRIDVKEYYIDLIILNQSTDLISEIKETVKGMVPANMVFQMIGQYVNAILLQIKTDTAFTVNTNFYPRYNAEFLTLDGTWTLNGKYSLTGYKTDSHIDFYPVGMKISTLIQNGFGTITRQSFRTDLKTRLESEVVHKFNSEHDTNVKKDSTIYIRSSTNIETKITSTLTSAKDIWKIDGSVRLGEGRIIPEKIDNNIL